jgi:hypothetical protein
MLKLVSVTVLSILAAAGLVLAVVTATAYLAGDVDALSSVCAVVLTISVVALLIALLERANRRASGPGGTSLTSLGDDRDVDRMRHELRAVGNVNGWNGGTRP